MAEPNTNGVHNIDVEMKEEGTEVCAFRAIKC